MTRWSFPLLVFLTWLGVLPPAWADQRTFAWQFPLRQYPSVQFVLRYARSDANETTGGILALSLLPAHQCPPLPEVEAGWDTLCATFCLHPSDYALTVEARQSGYQSAESNEITVQVATSATCGAGTSPTQPPTPPPSTTPPQQQEPSSNVAATVAGAAAILAGLGAVVAESTPSLGPDLPNMGCVDWAITGICLCGFPPTPTCVTVGYWEPYLLIETVKTPGKTALTILKPLLDAALNLFGMPNFGGGGAASGSRQPGQTNLHYNETHVYAFPNVLGGPCTSCLPTPGLPFKLHYASEFDPLWRTATAVPSPLDLFTLIGAWGPLYPRTGNAINGSEVVASGVAANRGMNIAFNPTGVPPNVEVRRVLEPIPTLSTCCQLAWPKQTPCFPPGTPAFAWEDRVLSFRGSYVWLYWRKRSCCVKPENATCGITLPGVGQHGQSACVIPSTP
jgi:TraU protein